MVYNSAYTILIVAIGLIIIGIVMLTGRGSFLIAGYNSMLKEEKEKYDKKALTQFTGKLQIVLGLCFTIVFFGKYFAVSWLVTLGIALALVFAGFAMIYANTSKRIKKQS
ncbi:MAG: DUF3784 domain-containing protein [Candidatus Cloacimonetes bacterium]|nr:DUF3784 domain-containing protein [Candidatus Cloacimonadota bacterium]